jgi:hypothetical protein
VAYKSVIGGKVSVYNIRVNHKDRPDRKQSIVRGHGR